MYTAVAREKFENAHNNFLYIQQITEELDFQNVSLFIMFEKASKLKNNSLFFKKDN